MTKNNTKEDFTYSFFDYTGQEFGDYIVIGMERIGNLYYALFKCKSCGDIKKKNSGNFKRSENRCKCSNPVRIKNPSPIGMTFGYLKAIRYDDVPDKNRNRLVICECLCCGRKDYKTTSSTLWRKGARSCGCARKLYGSSSGDKNPFFTGYKEIRSRFWRGYKKSAEERGHEFSITMEYAWEIFETQGRKCALSGVELVFASNRKNSETTASIDRIDCKKGYVVGNIQWVHKTINLMKNVLDDTSFVSWCSFVTDFQKKKKEQSIDYAMI